MSQQDDEEAYAKLSLNLLDTNISPERIVVFNEIMLEESEEMFKRIMSRLAESGFSEEEVVGLVNNIMGTLADNVELFQFKLEE